MRISAIRQEVWERSPDFRKSTGCEKTSAANPIELTRSMVVARTDSSSSTIEISGFTDILVSGLAPTLAPRNGAEPLCREGAASEIRKTKSQDGGTGITPRH